MNRMGSFRRIESSKGLVYKYANNMLLPSSPPVRRQRISDWVYDELSAAIRDLELEPGAVMSEPRLAARLNVSRAPVREAITRLVEQRLVYVRPQIGTQVAPISLSEVEQACFVRASLEVGAFQRAIAGRPRDLGGLRGRLAEADTAIQAGDVEAFFLADELLHQEVFALAGFPGVWDLVRGAKINLDRLRRLYLRRTAPDFGIQRDHEALVVALESGDEKSGVDVIRRHSFRILTDSKHLLERFPGYVVA